MSKYSTGIKRFRLNKYTHAGSVLCLTILFLILCIFGSARSAAALVIQDEGEVQHDYSVVVEGLPWPQIGQALADEVKITLAADGKETDASWKIPVFWLNMAGEEAPVPASAH